MGNKFCTCHESEKHGQTSVMCCNNCGLPDEEFWHKPPQAGAEMYGELYRWVKASERLPEYYLPNVIWRYGDSHKAIPHCDIEYAVKKNLFNLLKQYEWLEPISGSSQDEWNKYPEARPSEYGKYEVYRQKCSKQHYETWNNTGWAYNNNDITHWRKIISPPNSDKEVQVSDTTEVK